jgi:NAD(P)-dependent dehydrogenase (short-subunit alcohol dehydrogenase family)
MKQERNLELDAELAQTISLAGKVAVITGAGSGLGQEAARIFAKAGAHLLLADIDETGLAATAALIGDGNGRVIRRRVDVSRREEREDLADAAITGHGRLDVWVNRAGISFLHTLAETDPGRAQQVIAVNMMGPYWG